MMLKYIKICISNNCTIDMIYRDDTSEDHGGMLILKLVNVKNVEKRPQNKAHMSFLSCVFTSGLCEC